MNVLTLRRTCEVFVDEMGGDVRRQNNWNCECVWNGEKIGIDLICKSNFMFGYFKNEK